MFGLSFGELFIIGVVGLIVIGPERLPTVARTLGHLVGRAQRYVSDVKGDIQREMDIQEIAKIKEEMQSAVSDVKSSVEDTASALRNPVNAFRDDLQKTGNALRDSVSGSNATTQQGAQDAQDALAATGNSAGTSEGTGASAAAPSGAMTGGQPATPLAEPPVERAAGHSLAATTAGVAAQADDIPHSADEPAAQAAVNTRPAAADNSAHLVQVQTQSGPLVQVETKSAPTDASAPAVTRSDNHS